jgi:hypothetical protein
MASRTDNSDHGGDGREAGRNDQETAERLRAAEDVAEHQANVNQVRHEPMPASRHDDPRQEAVERNEEHGSAGQEGR